MAIRSEGVGKPGSCHTLRPSFASRLLWHAAVQATMIYTHVLNEGGKGVKGPWSRYSYSQLSPDMGARRSRR